MTPTVAMIGAGAGGAFSMRCQAVAEMAGWPLLTRSAIEEPRRYNVIIYVKGGLTDTQARRLRRKADVVIYDVLDAWSRRDIPPKIFFRKAYEAIGFDYIIATTPSSISAIKAGVPDTVTWLLPHHADPRCNREWYRPDGPVVYSGSLPYLGTQVAGITQACKRLGVEFKVGPDVRDLKGARLALAVRLPPTDTDLNRICKPQVKVENALACGIPVLASNHPCITSLHPWVSKILHQKPTVDQWTEALKAALKAPRPDWKAVSLKEHVDKLKMEIARNVR